MEARKLRLEDADSKALQEAMRAAPNKLVNYQTGDSVCYWRRQRTPGCRRGKPRWHGRALSIGSEGRNYYLAHAGRVLKAAPEQLRRATQEEEAADSLPNWMKEFHGFGKRFRESISGS